MKLTPEQEKTVAQWLAEEASIADVQKRLHDEFGISITFMETRFLIDDLGLNLKDAPKSTDEEKPATDPGGSVDADAQLVDDDGLPLDDQPGGGTGGVMVEVDRVTRPGTSISGTVTFSDGNSGKWALDQFGRIIFEGATPEYRPSQEDLEAFQHELSRKLQSQGY